MKDLISIIFIAFVMLVPYIVNHYSNPNYKIVYIKNDTPKAKKIKNKQTSKNFNTKTVLTKKIIINPIKNEALECLVSLGMKKTEAKIKVDKMFLVKDYENLEHFIVDAYRI